MKGWSWLWCVLLCLCVCMSVSGSGRALRQELMSALRGRYAPANCKRLSQDRKPCCSELDLLIGSSGGVGTKFVADYYDKYQPLREPFDGPAPESLIKHYPRPPIILNRSRAGEFGGHGSMADFVAFYVFDDPVEAIIKLFDHKLQVKASMALSGGTCMAPGTLTDRHSVYDATYDYFRLNEHILHWFFDTTPYHRIFIRGSLAKAITKWVPLSSIPLPIDSLLRHEKEYTDEELEYFLLSMEALKLGAGDREGSERSKDTEFVLTFLSAKKSQWILSQRTPPPPPSRVNPDLKKELLATYGGIKALIDQMPPIFVKFAGDGYDAASSVWLERSSGDFFGVDMTSVLDAEFSPQVPMNISTTLQKQVNRQHNLENRLKHQFQIQMSNHPQLSEHKRGIHRPHAHVAPHHPQQY